MEQSATDDLSSKEEVAASLESTDVVGLGRRAQEIRRELFGERVYYGWLSKADEIDGSVYTEVSLEDFEDVDPDDVDVFVGAAEHGLREHGMAWDVGVATDYRVHYGDRDLEDVASELVDLYEADEQLRAVEMAPAGRTTAYEDLAAAATARLMFSNEHVRLDREKAGEKIVQTSLEFGVDDVGFVDGEEDVRDVELLAGDLGFEAVERGTDAANPGDGGSTPW